MNKLDHLFRQMDNAGKIMKTVIDPYVWKIKEKKFEEKNDTFYKGLVYLSEHFHDWYENYFDYKKIPGRIIDEVLYSQKEILKFLFKQYELRREELKPKEK